MSHEDVYLRVEGEPRYSPRRNNMTVTFSIHGAERLPDDALRGVTGAELSYKGSTADQVHKYVLVTDGDALRSASIQDILIAVAKGNEAARNTLVKGRRISDAALRGTSTP